MGKTIVVPGVGMILVSVDGGANWSTFEMDGAPFAAHLCDEMSGVLGATRGIYRFQIGL